MTDVAQLRRDFDRLAAAPRPDVDRLARLAGQIEAARARDRRAREIASTVGPNRSHALTVTDDGVQRVRVTRVEHLCPAFDPGSSMHRTTLEIIGDAPKTEPCPHCGRAHWRDT